MANENDNDNDNVVEPERLDLDCTAGEGARQGRIKRDSPDYDEFSEFQRDTVLAAKAAPKYSTVRINKRRFILLGNHSSRGARGTSCLVVAPLADDGAVGKQRYFYDWSKNNGAVLASVEFPGFAEFKARRTMVQKLNFSPIPNGTGSNPEWHAACTRGEFLAIGKFFDAADDD